MKVYLDDERPTPPGWVRCYWPDEVIKLLRTGKVKVLSLDHDLGNDRRGTGMDVLNWLENAVADPTHPDVGRTTSLKPPKILIHSDNASAVPVMKRLAHRIHQLYKDPRFRVAFQKGAANLKTLKPNDRLKVYHGTRLAEVFNLINGFDATKVQSRSYGGPRHKGLFVTPTFETANHFASYGPVVLEIEVRAKTLHGTDYSGVTGRDDPRREEVWRDKYPDSFRPYLSQTLLQKSEPQALLQGLVSPRQIKRVWYASDRKGQGKWYTRKDFLNLGLEAIPAQEQPYGRKQQIRDLGVDISYPNYDYDEFLDAMGKLLSKNGRTMSRNRIEKTLGRYAEVAMNRGREKALVDLIEKSGFEPRAARAYAERFKAQLAGAASPSRVAARHLEASRKQKRQRTRHRVIEMPSTNRPPPHFNKMEPTEVLGYLRWLLLDHYELEDTEQPLKQLGQTINRGMKTVDRWRRFRGVA